MINKRPLKIFKYFSGSYLNIHLPNPKQNQSGFSLFTSVGCNKNTTILPTTCNLCPFAFALASACLCLACPFLQQKTKVRRELGRSNYFVLTNEEEEVKYLNTSDLQGTHTSSSLDVSFLWSEVIIPDNKRRWNITELILKCLCRK